MGGETKGAKSNADRLVRWAKYTYGQFPSTIHPVSLSLSLSLFFGFSLLFTVPLFPPISPLLSRRPPPGGWGVLEFVLLPGLVSRSGR